MPVTGSWSDEKLILLYCPGRGSNSRPSARRSFKHDRFKVYYAQTTRPRRRLGRRFIHTADTTNGKVTSLGLLSTEFEVPIVYTCPVYWFHPKNSSSIIQWGHSVSTQPILTKVPRCPSPILTKKFLKLL